jgi:rhamnose transport system permease protein
LSTGSNSKAIISFGRHRREWSVAFAAISLFGIMAIAAPSFYSSANLRDLALTNAPVVIIAAGMTLVILTGHIDISVGSGFAVCTVMTGWLAKLGLPMPLVAAGTITTGLLIGAGNGLFAGTLGLPSIVVTLATMVILRDGLRWATQGAWIQDLPAGFQWAGLGQLAGQLLIVVVAASVFAFFGWAAGNLSGGRAVYATGSDSEAARLAGIRPQRVVLGVFAVTGALVGMAALLNTIRFAQVQSTSGVGLEMKVIAAVVVGGASITGGRGTMWGTLIGCVMLGIIGTALTFLGASPYWEKAIQGGIILAALALDTWLGRSTHNLRTERGLG